MLQSHYQWNFQVPSPSKPSCHRYIPVSHFIQLYAKLFPFLLNKLAENHPLPLNFTIISSIARCLVALHNSVNLAFS